MADQLPPPTDVSLIPNVQSLSSVQENKMYLTLTIDRIFNLLVKMTQALQDTAAAQSGRLQFLSQWQKAYTDSMNQIHQFVKNNGDFYAAGTDPEDGTLRDDLNRVNSTYTEELRSRRSQVSDEAKTLQTNVNQTSDAVNQQTNMATSLLQELSTILSAIYK
jgi:methyl-accepting chemotaxis protein